MFIIDSESMGGRCYWCLMRVPYGTLVATVFCSVGVSVFLVSLYKAVKLILVMFEDVFSYDFEWLSKVQVIFFVVGSFMGLLTVVLLTVGIFSTGATRSEMCRGWKARLGGRISCCLCMTIVYLLSLVWIVIVCIMIAVLFVFKVLGGVCENTESEGQCVDLRQFYFLFPNATEKQTLNLCQPKRKVFCTETVEYAGYYFDFSFAGSVLVLVSMVHFLMCLAANYTRIKDQEKLQDLQELQYLQDSDIGPKDRF